MVIAVDPSEADVRAELGRVPDPEIPVLSVVDLGIVHRVEVDAERIDVAILPTFVGCPGTRHHPRLDRRPARRAIRPAGARRDDLRGALDVRADLARRPRRASAAGIAPPAAPGDVRCPHCDSADVVMDSAFGPTQCRSLFYCRGCRQPFEALKSV